MKLRELTRQPVPICCRSLVRNPHVVSHRSIQACHFADTPPILSLALPFPPPLDPPLSSYSSDSRACDNYVPPTPTTSDGYLTIQTVVVVSSPALVLDPAFTSSRIPRSLTSIQPTALTLSLRGCGPSLPPSRLSFFCSSSPGGAWPSSSNQLRPTSRAASDSSARSPAQAVCLTGSAFRWHGGRMLMLWASLTNS